jgi:luciferase family oxidoreductase group 1
VELQAYFRPARPGQPLQAVPGAGQEVPLWILGSSLYGAQLAAALGLPYAFASHFAPDALDEALRIYREQFRPSEQLDRPYVAAAINVFADETEAGARRLFTSLQQQFLNLRRGTPGQLPPPVDDMDRLWSAAERAGTERALSCAAVGTPAQVRAGLEAFLERTGADELVLTGQIFDHEARLRSFRLVSELGEGLAPRRGGG